MKRSIGLRAVRFLIALATAASLSWPARGQDRVALVIGNSKYVSANAVPNAVNDARLMAGALRDIGFVVADGFDLSRASMERQIREFLHKSEGARVALFFYAGHGLQVDGRNYLLPVSAHLEAASDLGFEAIGLDNILESLDGTSRTNIIMPQQSICAALRVTIGSGALRHRPVGPCGLFKPRGWHVDCVLDGTGRSGA
jgi:Caspase domain